MKNMTMKSKLALIAGIFILAISMIFGLSRYSLSTAVKLKDAKDLTTSIERDILELRKNEKDFLGRFDMKYHEKFGKNFKSMMSDLHSLEDVLVDQVIGKEETEKLHIILKGYQNNFNSIVSIQQNIGLEPESGLRGSLRDSVHYAEALWK